MIFAIGTSVRPGDAVGSGLCSWSDVVGRFSISAFCGHCGEQGGEMMRFLRCGRRCIEQEHGFSVLRFGIRDNL